MPTEPPREPAPSAAWLVVSGIVAVYFVFGLSIGVIAPMVDEISADLGLSRSAMGSILGAWPLIYIVTAIPCGVAVDRIGVRRSMLVGGATIALSFTLRAASVGGTSLFFAVAVFGFGGPLVSIASPKTIATLFAEDDRRLPLGFTVAAPTLGSAVGLALPDPVLLPAFDDSWRAVLLLAAGVSALATAYWWWSTRGLADTSASGSAGARPTTSVGNRLGLLRLATLRWILALSVLIFTIGHGLNGWFPEMLVDGGLSEVDAGYVAAVATMLGIGGGIGITRLVGRNHRPEALAAVITLMGLGIAGIVTLSGPALVATALGVGFVRAGMVPMLMLGIIDDPSIGVGEVGAATGLFFSISQFGGFGGPTIIGALADRSDGFGSAGVFMVCVCAAAVFGCVGWAAASRASTPQPANTTHPYRESSARQ